MRNRYLKFFKPGKFAQHIQTLPQISVQKGTILCIDDGEISEETAEHLVDAGRAEWCDDVKKEHDEAEEIIKKAEDDAKKAKAEDDAKKKPIQPVVTKNRGK